MIPYIASDHGLTLVLVGVPYTLRRSDPRYQPVIELIRHRSATAEQVHQLLNPPPKPDPLLVFSRTTIYPAEVQCDDEVIHSYLASRLLDLINQRFDVKPWILFMEKTQDHPIRDDLFRWLEQNMMPLTPDGNFIAYERMPNTVAEDLIGQTLSFYSLSLSDNPHSTSDDEPNFCSWDYLPQRQTGDRLLVLSINPRDVPVVPDQAGLGFANQYQVIGEITGDVAKKAFSPI